MWPRGLEEEVCVLGDIGRLVEANSLFLQLNIYATKRLNIDIRLCFSVNCEVVQ